MMRTCVVLAGGFLGAGKTTLLLQAARLLSARGRRVGLVTNDQGADLVDTALAAQREIPVTEVAGGCFCCRFPDLVAAFNQLRATVNPDVILAEPVGSCTDLMATVLLPLHRYYGDLFDIAPLTVLVDPQRDVSAFSTTVDYLYRKQMAEAEILVLNKADVPDDGQRQRVLAGLRSAYVEAQVISLSAQTGVGVAGWLDLVQAQPSRLARVLDLDYAQYAEAEAGLGWLNAKAAVRSPQPFAADAWLAALLQGLAQAFSAQNAAIAHIKAQINAPVVQLKASVTQANAPVYWDMWTPHAETDRAQLLLNARVHCDPQTLEQTVRRTLAATQPQPEFRCDFVHFECFSPAPPRPTHRLGADVSSL